MHMHPFFCRNAPRILYLSAPYSFYANVDNRLFPHAFKQVLVDNFVDDVDNLLYMQIFITG